MKFVVTPAAGKWRWQLVDPETGEIIHTSADLRDTPREARAAAKSWRNRVYMATIEMGT